MSAPSYPQGWSTAPITDQEYHALPQLSSHKLLDFERSPRLFKAKHIDKSVQTDVTLGMQFGSLFHEAVLEPKRFMDRPVGPEIGKTSKAWKEFILANPRGVHPEDMRQILGMQRSIIDHPLANKLLSVPSAVTERVGFASLEGVDMRMKCDLVADQFILDLKSTYDSSDRAFGFDADKYGYLFQACVYNALALAIDGKPRAFYLLAVEKTYPFDVAVYSVPDAVLEKEMERVQALLKHYSFCVRENRWDFKNLRLKPIWLTNYYFERMNEL